MIICEAEIVCFQAINCVLYWIFDGGGSRFYCIQHAMFDAKTFIM